ncbi:thiamine pyrophosphate-dependent enzyme [Desulfosoma caldarium]|uniref:Pyruvate ferredoxin/flavodoxin oxidoreductase-like protein n=1 Tax=Desulfosoma caldarium TaxID=610254 RepID=A0A3N1VKK2_9BACT|nr:thiamine pyrophosphate-dependent enzyme [Desulfosoma caldarium]ROR03334.1 pyruvate ferredoxin/flavodoxin oxidoreductase-like protein [Desulfosoma caldarium]
MPSLLNPSRPPVFCPGCSHERSLHALDKAFQRLHRQPHEVVIVSDIGCSGLFDVFFATHAFHGLHGRALTYATGIKLAQPHATVVAVMGDGGVGIGGAHVLAACRRNLDLTLLVLNNFNFGMTGGQASCTTPQDAHTGSAFLNTLETPLDVCRTVAAAGAPFVVRRSVYSQDLVEKLLEALRYPGFAVVDIWGLCPGRYLKANPISPKDMDGMVARAGVWDGVVAGNERREYGSAYAEHRGHAPFVEDWKGIEAQGRANLVGRHGTLFLGAAGERVLSAGNLWAMAAVRAGLHVTQKSDYNITVMRGPSIAEVLLSSDPIDYPGIEEPDAVVVLAREGVERMAQIWNRLSERTLVIQAADVPVPKHAGRTLMVDFKALDIARKNRAMASLGMLARWTGIFSIEDLVQAAAATLAPSQRDGALQLLRQGAAVPGPGSPRK